MIELVLLACLYSKPTHCERFYLATEETMSIMECMITGQFRAVQWHEAHPGWQLRRWSCGMPRA